ncbi:MAG: glycosyltransferase family 2 protein, partial [Sandaracinaceae bacterium]
GASNAGARRATAPRLVFLNDATVVTPGWLSRLLAALDDGAGVAGPSTNQSGDRATEAAPYRDLRGLLSFAASRRERASVDVDKLSLFCLAIDRARFEALGGLDEGYGRGGFEDDELCMAVRRRGKAARLVESAWVHHHGSVSFDRMSVTERIQRFETNRHRFEQRWGVRWRAPV